MKSYTEKGSAGQIVFTSQSPSVLHELGASPLFTVHYDKGQNITTIQHISDTAQGAVRSIPEAFLAPCVIICEGQTEVGLLRAFEKHLLLQNKKKYSFVLNNVVVVDGGGSNATERAMSLHNHNYHVCLFMDSDKISEWKYSETDLIAEGIELIKWENGFCTEQRIVYDLPDGESLANYVKKAIELGRKEESILQSINHKYDGEELTSLDEIRSHVDLENLRGAIYESSKEKGWFKTVTGGEIIGDCIFQEVFDNMVQTDFYKKLLKLRAWICGEE